MEHFSFSGLIGWETVNKSFFLTITFFRGGVTTNTGKSWTMLLRGAKKHFNLGMLRIQGGIKNSPQTQSEMRRIKFLFWHYLMQIIQFWCLSYLNFGIFEQNSTFSYTNIQFYLFVLGG